MVDTRKIRVMTAAVILVLFASAPYLASLGYDFVYDDHGQLVENTFLRNPMRVLDVLSLRTLADSKVINGRRPMVLLTYFADRALWDLKPVGYRLTNLLFHAGSVLLVYVLANLLASGRDKRPRQGPAFAVAMLFGMHPVLFEAVHVPAFRPDVMYSFFVLLYLFLGLRLAGLSGRGFAGWCVLQMLALVFALGSKEASIVAPVLLAGAWACFPAARPRPRRMVIVLGASVALVIACAAMGLRSGSIQAATGPDPGTALRVPENLYTMPWLWLRSVCLLLWPHPLVIDRVVDPVTSLLDVRFLAGSALLVASVVVVLVDWRRRPWISLGLGWMLLGFAPVSNIVPLFNPMADRYLYFVAIGFALLVGRALAGQPFGRDAGSVVRLGVLGALSVMYLTLTFAHMPDWRNDLTLWSRTLENEPRSARAHTWVGLEKKQQGRLEEAMEHYRIATELNPRNVSAMINAGILYGQMGDVKQAETCFREAILRRPDKAAAHWNLAVALQIGGRYDEALGEVEEALRLEPFQVPALKARIVLLIRAERYEEALGAIEALEEAVPGDGEADAARQHVLGLMQ